MSANRLPFIESMRLLAAGLVFSQHVLERHRGHPLIDGWIGMGPGLLGVTIFFLVSGYVVPLSVRGELHFASFMVRRVCRIYPLLLATYALVLILGWTGLVAQWAFMAQATPFDWAANLLLMQDYVGARPFVGVTWTLAIEFVWYALFALSWSRWGDGAGRVLARALPVALLALAGLSLVAGSRIPLGRVGMIYVCVLGYLACLHDRAVIPTRELARHIAVFVAVSAVAGLVSFGWFHHAQISAAQVLVSALLSPLVFFGVVLWRPLRNARLLNHGWIPACGMASFSIYLLHPVGIAAGMQYAAGSAAAIMAALALTALLAFIGYRWVELPGIALGRTLSRLIRQHGAGAAPVAA